MNLEAFLAVIRHCEGASGENGYRMLFGGELFDTFADHPRRKITKPLGGKSITSTAAGAYQFLATTWDECRKALDLRDFSPQSQDKAAEWLIRRRGALDDVHAGRIKEALTKCAKEWASLPGSPYGQPTKSLAECLAVYHRSGGQFVPEWPFPQQKDKPMLPFLAAAIPALIQAAPALIRTFGNGDQSEKNAKAAEVVANIAMQSTGANNIQEATERIQNDPTAAAQFRQGVQDRYFELTEAGGGGISGAREANQQAQGERGPWMNPAIWIAAALLPLVYIVVCVVMFNLGSGDWGNEIKVMVITAVVSGVLGAITGYFLGSSMSSRTKDELIAKR